MKKLYSVKIYNIIMFIAFFWAFLALYCKVTVSQQWVSLDFDSDLKVTTFLLVGLMIASAMTILLRCLFEHYKHRR